MDPDEMAMIGTCRLTNLSVAGKFEKGVLTRPGVIVPSVGESGYVYSGGGS